MLSTTTLHLLSRAEFRLNDGFSVVAPIKVIVPEIAIFGIKFNTLVGWLGYDELETIFTLSKIIREEEKNWHQQIYMHFIFHLLAEKHLGGMFVFLILPVNI